MRGRVIREMHTLIRIWFSGQERIAVERIKVVSECRQFGLVGEETFVDQPQADFADDRLKFADSVPPTMTSSMHHDFERGNPLAGQGGKARQRLLLAILIDRQGRRGLHLGQSNYFSESYGQLTMLPVFFFFLFF